MLLDAIVLIAAFGLDYVIYGDTLNTETLLKLAILVGIFILIFLLSNKEEYLYDVTMFYYLDRVHKKITKSFIIASIATAAVMNYINDTISGNKFYIMFLIFAYIFVCIKMFLNRTINKFFFRGDIPRTAFVGEISSFKKFSYFMDKTSIQIKALGYIALDRNMMKNSWGDNYIGCLEDLEDLLRDNNIDQIYIMQKENNELIEQQQYIDLCIDMGVTVRIVVDYYKQRRTSSYVSTVGTYPVITFHTVSLNTYEQVIKRVLDVFGSLFGLILFSPIMLITAMAIRLDSPGPVIFKQVRVGQNGRHFNIYKFRSMYVDAEQRKADLLKQNELDGGVMFKIKKDPRITNVGRVIRKYSIDELPQFFNVFIGDMSLVGTRPPTFEEVEKYKREQWRRISIKPGITGMWQVSGRSDITNFDDVVNMDIEYIDNWNLFLDIKIILKTFWVLIGHKGAY